VVVAVLDSGVLKGHPDLSGALLPVSPSGSNPGLDLVGQVAIFVGSSQCSPREVTSMALSQSMSM